MKNINDRNKLIWVDLEMTGLDTKHDNIIEIASIVTDYDLNIVAEGPVLAIHQSQQIMSAMDDWNTKHHGNSGLIEKVLNSSTTMQEAEQVTLDFLAKHVAPGTSPLCGNGICQDRRFLARQMCDLEKFFHYRNLDVSTIKILAQIWKSDVAKNINKQSKHRALDDIKDSINELSYYRSSFFNLGKR
jgi:oligoribonuclease|tara:strand:+ start:17329 stop:17889 length:561 start_codon:yes stop_codon:yes gene_type:complete